MTNIYSQNIDSEKVSFCRGVVKQDDIQAIKTLGVLYLGSNGDWYRRIIYVSSGGYMLPQYRTPPKISYTGAGNSGSDC